MAPHFRAGAADSVFQTLENAPLAEVEKAKADGWSTTHASYPCDRLGACTLFLDAKPKFADFGVEIAELNTPHFDTLGCIIVNFVKVGKNVKMVYYYYKDDHETYMDIDVLQACSIFLSCLLHIQITTVLHGSTWCMIWDEVFFPMRCFGIDIGAFDDDVAFTLIRWGTTRWSRSCRHACQDECCACKFWEHQAHFTMWFHVFATPEIFPTIQKL